MEGKRFIHRLKLTNLLSFGPEGVDIELEPLNVLIGPNASGKSNFIEAISLLQAAPNRVAEPISGDRGGGITEWLWKGQPPAEFAAVEAVAAGGGTDQPLYHGLQLVADGYRCVLAAEVIKNATGAATPVYEWGKGIFPTPWHIDRPAEGHAHSRPPPDAAEPWRVLGDIDPSQSILAQRKEPERFPEITHLGRQYGRIQLYREWTMGRTSAPRTFQPADSQPDAVLPDASNLALVLNGLDSERGMGKVVVEELRRFHPRAERMTFAVMGGMIQILLHEEGLETPIRSTRLSDGTLHYLFLLAILHQLNPPPLVCIEEPELGLHPDIIPRVAELLVEASQRMQLIVTTHSDWLVSALSDVPEAVIVCERDDQGTHLRRLEREPLKEWLEEYTLGDLWARGQIGGTLR